MSESFKYTQSQEDRYDDLVDNKGFTPDMARQELGIDPGSIEDSATPQESEYRIPGDHRASSAKDRAGVQYGDNAEIENKDLEPHYYNRDPLLTEEEQERVHRGYKLATKALKKVAEEKE